MADPAQDPFAQIAKPVTANHLPPTMQASSDPFAAIAKPVAAKQPDAVPSFWDTLKREGKALTGTIAGIPAGIYHAVTDPPTEEEVGIPKDKLAVARLTALPAIHAAQWYADAAKGKYGDASQVESAMLNEAPEAIGSAAGSVIAGKLASETPGAAQTIVEKTPAALQATADTGSAAVRATARGVNTALQKAPGSIGATVGATAGGAVGGHIGAELGGIAGAVAGKELLPQVKIPGEGFGLPDRVTGGPATAPAYQPPPEPTPVYPGAPSPETPISELLQSRSLARPGASPSPEPSAGLGNLPPTGPSPAERLPSAFQPVPKKPPAVPGTAEAPFKSLVELPTEAVHQALQELGSQAPISALTERANNIAKLGDLLNQATGGDKGAIQPGVPIKNQGGIIMPKEETAGVLEGHTPVDSSALKSYKYDPEAHELEIGGNGPGSGYVYGDVSPEQAESFMKGEFRGQKAGEAPSFGKSWNELRKNSTPVAKIINGKRVPIRPAISDEDRISSEEWEAGHELAPAVEGSPRR